MSLTEKIADRAFAPVRAALEEARIPGAVLGIVTAGGERAIRFGGKAQVAPEDRPLAEGTIFDLASLTKVILTTTEVLRLAEEGRIDLDDPLCRHIPDLHQYDASAPVRHFTIRQCLTHQTGLVAVEPIYGWGGDPERLKALILQRDWPIGEKVYSDINFILLGILIERLRGRPLGETPLPDGLTFRPDPERTAATENCMWRGRVMRGEVHDENAFALGGLAGHAGLFGTISGVLNFAEAFMKGELLSPAAMAEIGASAVGNRALGWERRYPGWSGGGLCHPDTIGHTGFTGTGLWIDSGRGVAWSLLTNRVHPSRHVETGIMPLRRAVGNIVAAEWSRGG